MLSGSCRVPIAFVLGDGVVDAAAAAAAAAAVAADASLLVDDGEKLGLRFRPRNANLDLLFDGMADGESAAAEEGLRRGT